MICVSVGRTRHRMMQAEHRALVERGAPLVELRLDFLTHSPDLKRLLPERPGPIIVTCRRASDKGRWAGTEEQRLTILRAAIVGEVDYVDLEEDAAATIRRYGSTKRIVSYHNFDETPADLAAIHARLSKLDPDIVKIATMANSSADNVRMLHLVREAKIPTVGFCMGEMGVVSRILAGRFGSPFTYCSAHSDRALAPGQLTYREMTKVYRYDAIGPETQIFGVAGDPVGHSLSPFIHNTSFAQAGLDAVYIPFRIPKGNFAKTVGQYSRLGVRGFSVTLPHKESVLDVAGPNFRDQPVDAVGASNTLYRDAEGNWRAANTDYDAALESLTRGLSIDDEPSLSLAGKRVLLLGAGGVARAIGLGIVRSGGLLMVCNRTSARGAELAKHLQCQHVHWENRGAASADILINCTSVGMHPQVDETPFAMNWLRDGMIVFDTIYTPERTLLIKEALEHGCQAITGVEMFVRQAARQFELFTGVSANLEFLRKTVRAAISPLRTPEMGDI